MTTQMRKDTKTTNKDGLSPRQRQMYDVIKLYIKSNSYSPSYEELKQLVGLNSKSHVHGLVHQLNKRGWIKFANGRNRSISLV
jgi:repressor LexA